MKNILLKLICIFTLSIGTTTVSKAQLVYIPDSAFRAYLNQNFGACMVGDSIDSSCPAVLSAKKIDVRNRGIFNLSGIEIFVNDTLLDCSANQLTSLPNFPQSITYFDCSNNQLSSMLNLPLSLTYFDCSNNQFSSLPNLPLSLSHLYCFENQLTSLPILPTPLTILECHENPLTALPALPASLTHLTCVDNQLTTLPALPASLIHLNCYDNQLTSLPALPASLALLNCSLNPLSTLPTLPTSLTILYCVDNQLNTLPALPASLTHLFCNNNDLSSLPNLPATLIFLRCYDNQLLSLPALPASLTLLDCSGNQLATLPALPTLLNELRCDQNLLYSLPTLPASLIYLECNNNQLTSLPPLPFSLTNLTCSNNPLTCLPSLNNVTNLYFTNTLVNCLPNYGIVTASNPVVTTIPICGIFNTNGCGVFWNIEGTTFFDADTNCNQGSSEPLFKNQKLNLYKNGVLDQQTYSNINGDYDFNTFSFDLYTTELDVSGLPFDIHCPSLGFYLDSITAIDSIKIDRDFGLKCKDVDLAVTSIFSNNLRPASIREIKIQAGDYSNYFGAHCAMGISGTVTITITGECNYFSPAIGALTPNIVTGNVLTYNVVDFGILSYDSSFNFNILVDTSAALASLICIQVSISTPSAELNYYNNLLSQCFTVVGSFDPNDKTAFPNSTLDISGDRWLTYLIRFQNTGTASAEHIFITDTLSTSLDWSTFNLLSYSHQPLTQVYIDGLVKFSFPHINLPDSNTNEPASHGFVQYKIRAKDSLSIGSTIENTANIFFDFNAPVITNTTSNAIINCSIPPTIISASICNGEAYSLNGALYYNDGTYQQKLITSVGCDSIIELQLTVSSITNTISQSSAILQTAASGSGYQWIDCATNSAITGATNSTYQPTQSGDYAVAVTYGNCIDTSSCFAFSMVGLPSSIGADVIFQTRYNSNADQIQLHAEKLKGYKGMLRLMDISGRIIFQKQIENIAAGNLDIEIPAKGMNAGIYLVNLITERDNISGKVVKY
ncbi:MAG: T9SS type A sorting domain-containing protein [Bacteroidia bacterium]